MQKSWKTTVAGICAAVGIIAPQVAAALDNDPATVVSWEVVIGAIITAASLFGLGAVARDNDKSSESVGASK